MLMNLREVEHSKLGLVLQDTVELPRIVEENQLVERIQPVRADLLAHMANRLYHVDGELHTVVWYHCARCLDTFASALDLPFAEVFTSDARRAEDEAEDEIIYVEGEDVLLDPYIEQAINLAIEYRPLCKEDCQGLCPVCGRNRNHEPCACDTKPIDPRLSVLQDLLSEDESE